MANAPKKENRVPFMCRLPAETIAKIKEKARTAGSEANAIIEFVHGRKPLTFSLKGNDTVRIQSKGMKKNASTFRAPIFKPSGKL